MASLEGGTATYLELTTTPRFYPYASAIAFAHLPWRIDLSGEGPLRVRTLAAIHEFKMTHGPGFKFRVVFANDQELEHARREFREWTNYPSDHNDLAVWLDVEAIATEGDGLAPLEIAAVDEIRAIVGRAEERTRLRPISGRWRLVLVDAQARANLARAAEAVGVVLVDE